MKLLLSKREAAKLLGCSPTTLYRMIAAGQLHPRRMCPGGREWLRRREVEELVEKGYRKESRKR